MALGQAAAVVVHHQAAVEPAGIDEAESAVEQDLARRGLEQIGPATTSVMPMAASSATQASW